MTCAVDNKGKPIFANIQMTTRHNFKYVVMHLELVYLCWWRGVGFIHAEISIKAPSCPWCGFQAADSKLFEHVTI